MPFKVDDHIVEIENDLNTRPSDLVHLVVNVRDLADGSQSYDVVRVWPATGRPVLDQGCLELLDGRTMWRRATEAEIEAWRRLE
jgi:hypothetical protein